MNNKNVWWKNAVIYQIYPRSFHDTTGNGIGDIPGILEKVDYLADTLGVDAIWISPFYPSPMKDFGYDVADYCDIDPVFGKMEDFDQLLEKLHQHSIKLIIDWVPNHSSDQHPWFIESCSSRSNPKRDWYVWEDPKPDGSPPNNWLSVFGGSAWELDHNTNQYYLHSFLKEQPDLNWRNPQVQQAMYDVLRFWLDKGVDGFRIDVAHFIMKDPQLRDNPLNPFNEPSIHRSLGEYDSQIHLYDKGHPDAHQIYQQVRSILDQYSDEGERVSIGEIHIFDWQEWVSYYGSKLDEFHLPYNFTLLGTEWKGEKIREKVDKLESILPQGAWPNYVLGNHDEKRLATRLGTENAPLGAMLLLTLRGTPTLYYGDEIGMIEVEVTPEQALDPAGLNQVGYDQGRDGCRTPMQWSSTSLAGFSPSGSVDPWLPVADNFQTVNVTTQLQAEDSLLQLYRTLLKIRKEYPVLQSGDYQPLDEVPAGCYSYLRESQEEQLLICLNFNREEIILPGKLIQKAKILLSTRMDRSGQVGEKLTLRPLEGCIYKL